MNSFSSWIIAISSVCVLSVIIDLVLPDGKINGHIKTIFSFLIVFVIIAPLPSFLSGNTVDISSLYSDKIIVQENYIHQINRSKLDEMENIIECYLVKKGINGVQINISADIFSVDMRIDAVFVDLFDLVIKPEYEHIDIKTEIADCITDYLNISREKVLYNE